MHDSTKNTPHLFFCFITWWITLWIKLHVWWNGLKGEEVELKIHFKFEKEFDDYLQYAHKFILTCLEIKQESGPMSVNNPT
jgi:hypothetical protein